MWLAPEALSGVVTYLTKKIDIYAFGMVCTEILNKGAPPWGPLVTPDLLVNLVCSELSSMHIRLSEPDANFLLLQHSIRDLVYLQHMMNHQAIQYSVSYK